MEQIIQPLWMGSVIPSCYGRDSGRSVYEEDGRLGEGAGDRQAENGQRSF